ncbi:hypothetical protein CNMCM6106_003282 [Aspergillus hiratsukae]|uniref:FAD-binding PCMH-type domain-containing protein n=1 Tax=Aspergillus hiratsukae TaxID=1194566 RepID=A0A8H6Q8R6_9EURO|nr:hypothetical protein CNMCM6106_003282 [Aspergillus hiratsukae]
MSATVEEKALHQLQQEQSKLLDKIDELRTIGVEVILRRNPSSKIKVSIEPGPSRTDEQERRRLRSFAYNDFSNGNDLPALMEKAKEHMGITELVNAGFSDDVLKVEISGPDRPELTLVDLPGLYYSTSQEQDSRGILIVRKLTERYMKNPRSIILAVISPKTDYHLQEVLNMSERFDPKRERTLGIITQPDILEATSEEEETHLHFIKNQKIHLELGWHVLRNRSFETRDMSHGARGEMGKAFFNQGRWTSLSRECVGIESLRRRLSSILLKLIRRNLPGLIAEVQDKISVRQQQLSKLGPARSTLQQQRKSIPDDEVSPRYCYGEIRLTRLNFYSPFFLHRWRYEWGVSQYSTYFGRFYGHILFIFAMLSLMLSAMQVELAAESIVGGKWEVMVSTSRYFSVICIVVLALIALPIISMVVAMVGNEWVYAIGPFLVPRFATLAEIGLFKFRMMKLPVMLCRQVGIMVKHSELMNPYWQNQTCDPFTPKDRPCVLGNYVNYSINVTGANDVAAGIQFLKKHNVRLVIKNTGHDFLGKSTGHGGLALWMYNLKGSKIMTECSSHHYRGPAVRLDAGMTGSKAYEAVRPAGYRIVGGDCPTVGITGGYTQGGGHSLLINAYGMATDQVLEWEVIRANGRYLIATPTQHRDLYWALSGGGAGTFGVVLSMTVKTYPEGPIGSALLSINRSGVAGSLFECYGRVVAQCPRDCRCRSDRSLGHQQGAFTLESFTARNKTASEVSDMLGPFLSSLDALRVPYSASTYGTPTYYEHFNQTNGPLPYGSWPASMLFNRRLVSRAITTDSERIRNLTDTIQDVVDDDDEAPWNFGCMALNVKNVTHPGNAVVPYWRDAIAICITISRWDWTIPRSKLLARKEHLAEVITPAIEAATPGSGAYLDEADPYVYPPDSLSWQNTFDGSNCPRLRQIKDTWDLEGIFYANTAVGAEDWTVDGSGRLCRA